MPYSLNAERLRSLIELVTVFPEDSENKKRCHNHPFVACELLSESGPVHDRITENDELLATFFIILDSEAPHSTLLGYFSKTLLAMIGRNPEKVILYMGQNQVFGKVLNLLQSKALVDIVFRVLTVDIGFSNEIVEIQREIVRGVIRLLLTGNELKVLNSAGIISEVLARVPDIPTWKELVTTICEADNMKLIYDALKHEENFRVSAAGTVLKGIFGLSVKVNLFNNFPELDINSMFKESLPELNKKLLTSHSGLTYSTMKTEYESLGESRLRIVELVSCSLKQDNESLYEKIAESKILSTITQLFFDYPWHSILHSVFDSIVQSTLLSQNPLIISSFLLNPDLTYRLIKVCENPNPKHRYGHLGYIHKLCNNLKNSEIAEIKEFLSAQPNWQPFVSEYLTVRNIEDLKQLGEVNKNDQSSSSEEPESIIQGFNEHKRKNVLGSERENSDEQDDNKDEEGEENAENAVKEADIEEPDNIEDKAPTFHVENVFTEVVNEEHKEPAHVNIDLNAVDLPHSEKHAVDLSDSPLSRRRSNSGSRSPKDSTFACANFWKLPILVDELDGDEDLI